MKQNKDTSSFRWGVADYIGVTGVRKMGDDNNKMR